MHRTGWWWSRFLGCWLTMSMAACSDDPGVAPRERSYYVAADEVEWDYAPSGMNLITGAPFDDTARVFTENGPNRIGTKYKKALFREYTDSTFATLVPRAPGSPDEHLGFLGPIIRGQVGDTILFHLKNNTTRPVSVHPHGVFYKKDSEGAPYHDGTSGTDVADDAVPPGMTYNYKWEVRERSGPLPGMESSMMWMYHSHADEVADTYAGLVGPIIITARGMANEDGSPADIDRELVVNFEVSDENQSPYLQENVDTYTTDPATTDIEDEGFIESNKMHGINGYIFGNLPGLTMNHGERVRWYLMAMGTEVDLHTPHWHGNVVVTGGMRVDVVDLLPATMIDADMMPDDDGTWLFHCHVNDHILAGMMSLYTVNPAP